jgi:hypothetical protein
LGAWYSGNYRLSGAVPNFSTLTPLMVTSRSLVFIFPSGGQRTTLRYNRTGRPAKDTVAGHSQWQSNSKAVMPKISQLKMDKMETRTYRVSESQAIPSAQSVCLFFVATLVATLRVTDVQLWNFFLQPGDCNMDASTVLSLSS